MENGDSIFVNIPFESDLCRCSAKPAQVETIYTIELAFRNYLLGRFHDL